MKMIKNFTREKYETVMCIAAGMTGVVLPLKLVTALCFQYWNELIWVQLLQLCGIACLLCMILYLAHVYMEAPKVFTYKIKNYLYRHKWLIFFGLFIIWMFLSFLANKRYSDYQGHSAALYGIPSRNEGILLRTLEFVMAAGLLAVSDGRKKRRVLNLLLAASLLLTVPVLAQSNDGLADILGLSGNEAFRYMAEEGRYASVLNYFNHYGYYLCTMIVLSGSMLMLAETAGGVCFSLLVYVINIITLNINNTFGGWLAAGISLIVLLFLMTGRFHGCKSRQAIYPYFKFFAAVLLFFLISGAMEKNGEGMFSQTREFFFELGEVAKDSESDEAKAAGTGRWKLWVECAGFIMEKPVFGWCEDGIADRYSEAGFVQDRPANEYLEYAAFYGIPGAAFYLAAVFWIAADRLCQVRKLTPETLICAAAAMGYLISACFGNTTNYVTMHFFVLLGFAMGDS